MTSESNFEQSNQPEQEKVSLEDNARKFTVEPIELSFLERHNATGYLLVTDWLETNEDSEKKVVRKEFENGDIQTLLITKVTGEGGRTTDKQKITDDEHDRLLGSSVLRVAKLRREFTYDQNGRRFAIKYDDFGEGKPKVLEVDAPTDQERGLFDPADFPVALTEVTDDMSYYGYRVAEHL